MAVSSQLVKLIDAAAPYWAGEAEVFKAYWGWDQRSRESDRRWLEYQCSKETWGSGFSSYEKGMLVSAAEELLAAFPKADTEIDRHTIRDIAEGLWAEFAHYCAFADAYDALALPGERKMTPAGCKVPWKEDMELSELRFAHKREYPEIGLRATKFTEGGYCTLFAEGMKLRNRNGGKHARADEVIAEACTKVYEDEFGHMLKGVVGLGDENMGASDWKLLEDLSILQLKARIKMRNSQFGYPLSGQKLDDAVNGRLPPIGFDYAKAQEKLAA